MSIGLDESRRAATHPVIAAKPDYRPLDRGIGAPLSAFETADNGRSMHSLNN
jgi:hypothetical protein